MGKHASQRFLVDIDDKQSSKEINAKEFDANLKEYNYGESVSKLFNNHSHQGAFKEFVKDSSIQITMRPYNSNEPLNDKNSIKYLTRRSSDTSALTSPSIIDDEKEQSKQNFWIMLRNRFLNGVENDSKDKNKHFNDRSKNSKEKRSALFSPILSNEEKFISKSK